ncbi:MAG: hypothetical protein WB566_15480 [Terriglobales bacterium]
MKHFKYIALLSTLALLFPLAALARDKNEHSVDVSDRVQVGSTQLNPGKYKVEWQGTGPQVEVTFLRNGETVATVPGTLKMNDNQVTMDAVVIGTANSNVKTLQEIDFGHQKEALVFGK